LQNITFCGILLFMSESPTVLDQALRVTSREFSFVERMLFTGRVLVKEMHENMELPDPIDPDEATQYYAPELRSWAKPLFKVALLGLPDTSELYMTEQAMLFNSVVQYAHWHETSLSNTTFYGIFAPCLSWLLKY
jgi:hypothetical protein